MGKIIFEHYGIDLVFTYLSQYISINIYYLDEERSEHLKYVTLVSVDVDTT